MGESMRVDASCQPLHERVIPPPSCHSTAALCGCSRCGWVAAQSVCGAWLSGGVRTGSAWGMREGGGNVPGRILRISKDTSTRGRQ
eukprot:COSAG06_NODE_2312_length_7100_cov_7.782609_5_plen_86_part_00